MCVTDADFERRFDHWVRYNIWRRKQFIGTRYAWEETSFRFLAYKENVYLHLYGDASEGCIKRLWLGYATWMSLPVETRFKDAIMAIERRKKATADAPVAPWRGDHETALAYPTLCERLTETTFADGSKRITDTITVFSQDRTWRAALNDRETGDVIFVSAETLVGLLEALETELVSDEPNWRTKKGDPPQKKRR